MVLLIINAKFKEKKEDYGMWKKGQATWELQRNAVGMYKDVTRKDKINLELNLSKDIKDNKNWDLRESLKAYLNFKKEHGRGHRKV